MMEWALSILFGVAILLLFWSFVKGKKSAKIEKSEIEQFSISIMEEMQQLQQQMRNLELDQEITAQQAGAKTGSPKQRALLREVIDLHRRGYSPEGIAAETRLNESEIKLMLAPYMERKDERRKVANES
jgi:hypothetical protein